MMYNILTWAVFGLIAGAIARFVLPGKQSMSIVMTIVLGVVDRLLAERCLEWFLVVVTGCSTVRLDHVDPRGDNRTGGLRSNERQEEVAGSA